MYEASGAVRMCWSAVVDCDIAGILAGMGMSAGSTSVGGAKMLL